MIFHIPDIFNMPVGEPPIESRSHRIKKIFRRKVDAFKKILSLCRPLGKKKSAPVMSCRIGQVQLIFPGPQCLSAIDGGLKLGRNVIKIYGSRQNNNIGLPKQRVDFIGHIIIFSDTVAFLFTITAADTWHNIFFSHLNDTGLST